MSTNPQRESILRALNQFPDGTDADTLRAVLDPSPSKRTLQRWLRDLVNHQQVEILGKGRAIKYRSLVSLDQLEEDHLRITAQKYETFIPLSEGSRNIIKYVRQPIAGRKPVAFDRGFIEGYKPGETWYLNEVMRTQLKRIGETGEEHRPAGTYGRAILDRLLIDLSWSSSRLEGNTYTRLDTQRLIELGQVAQGKDAKETQMILNHKGAIEFLLEDADEIDFNSYTFLSLHGLLSENLLSDPSASGRLRRRVVEIGRSVYYPINVPQIIEEIFLLILQKAEVITDPFEQAFFILVHIPYLQPFEDVNKRVARLGANISLIKDNLCPLTFIDVPERAYIDSMLGIYEMNRIELLRDLFIWAYERSTQQYIKVKNSLEEPDPMRLKYHEQIYEIVGTVVRDY